MAHEPADLVFVEYKGTLPNDRTIPINRTTLDDPLKFVHYNPATLHRTLDRLSFYRVFSWGDRIDGINYCNNPVNIWFDADNTLMLYAEFGEPRTNFRTTSLPDGLAVCGFNQGDVLFDNGNADLVYPNIGITLDIVQFQTALFDDHPSKSEKEMFHYLGFIKYRDFFTHVIEQVVWKMHHIDRVPVNYVSIAINSIMDRMMAVQHLRNLDKIGYEEEIDQEIKRIRNKRKELAEEMGYASVISVSHEYRGESSSYAKPITDIQPDNKLQQHIAKIGVRLS